MKHKCLFRPFLLSLALVVLLSACNAAPNGEASGDALAEGSYLRVDFVDVGQADFIVVECDGEFMTIDGGNVADRSTVVSVLEERGINEIKYVIATHAHEDHCGGIPAILAYASVGSVYCPLTDFYTSAYDEFLYSVDKEGLEVTQPLLGEQLSLGSAKVQVIGPVKTAYEDVNDTSIVLRLTFGERSFLFTGDAEIQAENDIMSLGVDISADVLKVGHHGSASSTSYRWLKTIGPQYAIISSNREEMPDYNHPHQEVVSRLRDAEVTVYRTDLQGTITCITYGDSLAFMVERNPDVDTLYDAGPGGNHE